MEGISSSGKLKQKSKKDRSSSIMVDFGCQARQLFRTMDNLFFTPRSVTKAVSILHQSISGEHTKKKVVKSKSQWALFCRLLDKNGLFALLNSTNEDTKPVGDELFNSSIGLSAKGKSWYNSGTKVLMLPQADVSPKSLSLVPKDNSEGVFGDFKTMSIRDKVIPKSTVRSSQQLVDFGPEALLIFKTMQNWDLRKGRIYLAAIISYLDSTAQHRLKRGETIRSKSWWSAFCQLLSSYGFFSWDSSDNTGIVGNTSRARSKELFMASVTLSDKAKNWVKNGDKALKLKLTPEFVQRVSNERFMPRKFSASAPHPSVNVKQNKSFEDVLMGKKIAQAYMKIPEPPLAIVQSKKIDFGKEARALFAFFLMNSCQTGTSLARLLSVMGGISEHGVPWWKAFCYSLSSNALLIFSGIDLLHDGASVSLSSKAREWYSSNEEILLVQPTKEMSQIIRAEIGEKEAAALANASKLIELDPLLQKRLDDLKAKLVASIGTKGSSTGCTLNETIAQYEMDWSEPLSKYKETFHCKSWIDLFRLLPSDIRIQRTSDPEGLRIYPAITSFNCHAFEMIDKTLGGEDSYRELKKTAKQKRNRQQ